MEDPKHAHKAHVLVVPFPAQGHINPMLQFCKRLSSKGIKTTLAPTVYILKSMHNTTTIPSPTTYGPPVQLRPISDGYDEGGYTQAESTATYLDSLNIHGPKTLFQLIKRLTEEGDPVKAVVYDGVLPWALDVAKQFGLAGVVFFTQTCTVNSIYYHVQRGLIPLPLNSGTVLVPGVPELQPSDVPSFVHNYGSYPFWFDVFLGQFSNIDQADWVLFNIFYDMEKEVVEWMAKMWKVRTIGPTVPSYYLDKRLEDDRDYNLQLLKPSTSLCKNWLDTKPRDSVIYLSFGSAAKLSEEQFEELARGLKNSQQPFLWVVREPEQQKLPQRFIQDICDDQGLVVGWASQLEVLSHEATCCFVTHCGFNSVLEALSLGVVMVGIPQWTDQGTNAKFVEDVWGVGVRATVDEKGIVRRDKLEKCIKEVVGIEGDKKQVIMKNVAKWKKLAKEAMDEGGSSDKNIDEFVSYLMEF